MEDACTFAIRTGELRDASFAWWRRKSACYLQEVRRQDCRVAGRRDNEEVEKAMSTLLDERRGAGAKESESGVRLCAREDPATIDEARLLRWHDDCLRNTRHSVVVARSHDQIR